MDFDVRVLEPLAKSPYFRLPTDEEVDGSWAAYRSGDTGALVQFWRAHAEPTRGTLQPNNLIGFRQAHLLPAVSNGAAFLAISRSVIAAGKKLRDRLRPEIETALSRDFPWLEVRHEHIPPGWAPEFEFPDAIRIFLDEATVEEAKV